MSSQNQHGYDHDIAQRWLANMAKWDNRLHAMAKTRLKPITEAVGGLEGAESANYRVGLETIVRRSRPVLPIRNDRISLDGANIDDEESRHVVDALREQAARIEPVIPLVGRIDVVNDPMGRPFLGTGWLVGADLVVTNRHVAGIIGERSGTKFVFQTGRFGNLIGASLDFKHEIDGVGGTPIKVAEVLWIEPQGGDRPDIAFLRLEMPRDGARQNRIEVADSDAAPGTRAAVIGYPARAPAEVIPDQQWMDRIYRNTYDVKRIAPGLITEPNKSSATHDCTTLGGNSGSVVIDTATGKALGLHYAGVYLLENYAVPASTIRIFLKDPPWLRSSESRRPPPDTPPPRKPAPAVPPSPPPGSAAPPVPAVAQPAGVTITIPLVVTVALGQPTAGGPPQVTATTTVVDAQTVSHGAASAAKAFSEAYRGEGLLGATAGRAIVDGRVTDRGCIRAVAHPDRYAEVKRRLPAAFEGYPVEVRAASLMELSEASGAGIAEAVVTSISYNDDDRTGPDFSFAPLAADMSVLCHVGPERSWVVLKEFLGKAQRELVCSMYEFHARYIADQIADRLTHDSKVDLVLATQSRDPRSGPVEEPDSDTFNRRETFAEWHREFGDKFENIFVPIGSSGLVANAYHIKVTVRDKQFVWLSSGNWKSSSQPLIAEDDLNNPKQTVAAGNREWHVVIDNPELANRFRSHILADLAQSKHLGGQEEALDGADALVDVPSSMLEAVEEAPRAPTKVLDPKLVAGQINVKPLLTPDKKGAIYSNAVLDLIRSARNQLLFQIPYITVKPNEDPDAFINQLVDALVEKAKTIDDVRVILRTDNGQWKPGSITLADRGMDTARQLRHVGSTHTKGMIVDGERVMVGSHNWSAAGVTLNRDASLIFSNTTIADYFKEAFEMDWARARQVSIQEAVTPEAVSVRLATPGSAVPAGHRRMRLADYLEM